MPKPAPPPPKPRAPAKPATPAPRAPARSAAWIDRERVKERLAAYLTLVRADKPIGWLLLLWPTWWGLWHAAHGTLYAMVDREDDLEAGAKSTAILFCELDLVAVGILDASFLLAMALVGVRAGLGHFYAAGWLVAAAVAIATLYIARSRSREA